MTRVKKGLTKHSRHKRYLKMAKGMYGRANRCYRIARRCALRGLSYKFKSRKLNKRIYRSNFIAVINTACRKLDSKYSLFISFFNKSKFSEILDRKTLALIIQEDFEKFKYIFNSVTSYG